MPPDSIAGRTYADAPQPLIICVRVKIVPSRAYNVKTFPGTKNMARAFKSTQEEAVESAMPTQCGLLHFVTPGHT
jgi:hypothetical protein